MDKVQVVQKDEHEASNKAEDEAKKREAAKAGTKLADDKKKADEEHAVKQKRLREEDEKHAK